ncbi:hypothetical protein [Helicobacter kayseriensis]|uniref:hypothetical protein n=1 Tax=Helicobacter kayseriensis TaxID=2905877 RepID=UPI001E4064DB|nr:hypothetical protein [Helicobacter kayseriensis]MCE3047109.1 hypothetical protein [Helicobacter kayseriensis]MCE3048231.1 hypothetical protein [Helicobacter kayseriensis]
MNISGTLSEDTLLFECEGKLKSPKDLFLIKKTIFSLIEQNSNPKNLSFLIHLFPINLSFLGFLLTLNNAYRYEVQIIVTNYSNYRMLEDLYLLQKFHVIYRKNYA